MSRSYSTFREMEPFADAMKKATYSATVPSNHVQHPFIMEAEGRQIPIIRPAGSGSNGETFVIKAEKVIERSFVPAPISRFLVAEYRYSSEQPGKEEKFKDYDEYSHPGSTHHCPEKAQYTHLDPSFDRPEEVEEFITKIVTEAGRGPTRSVVIPLSSGWNSGPNRVVQENTRKYGDEREFRGDDRKKQNDSSNWDRHNEPHLKNKGANTHPAMGNSRRNDSPNWDRHNEPYLNNKGANTHPVMGKSRRNDSPNWDRHNEPYLNNKFENTHPVMGKSRLNDNPNWDRHNEPHLNNKGANTQPVMGNIRDVYDFYERPGGNEGPNARSHPLSKPTNDIGTAVEFLKELSIKPPSYGNENRPTKTLPLGSTRPYAVSNISAPESKKESKDYESDESEEDEEKSPNSRHGKRDEFNTVNNQGGRQPFDKKDGYEKPKGNAAAVPFTQTRFPSSAIQKKKQYASPEKIDRREASRRYGRSSPRAMEEEKHEGTISSRDAMIKYNGALIPSRKKSGDISPGA